MSKLIIYFSRSGENYFSGEIKHVEKGNTEVIAEYIREFTGARMFKVEAKNEYPEDYAECGKIAKAEKESDARPELKEALMDISQYDEIFIGYPNWCGTLPMPMWTQLEQLDFTGKVVKPFVTHEGSGFGTSEDDLEKLCSGAVFKKGMAVLGKHIHDAKDFVKIWTEE